MFRHTSCLPRNSQRYQLAIRHLFERDIFDEQSYDPLALSCIGKLPDSVEVFGQLQNFSSLAVCERPRLLSLPRAIFLFDCFLQAQFVLPRPLQGAGYQSVLGFNFIVLTPGAFYFAARSFTI